MRLETLNVMMIEGYTRSRGFAEQGRPDIAEMQYETLFHLLYTLLSSEESGEAREGEYAVPGVTWSQGGWRQVALQLADRRRPLSLDALGSTRLDLFETRATALLNIPQLPPLRRLADVQEAIIAAIEIGAPCYNDGAIRGCCAVYWATLHTLLATPPAAPFAGYAEAMAELRQLAEERAAMDAAETRRALDARAVDDYAWALRHCFDAVLEMGQTRRKARVRVRSASTPLPGPVAPDDITEPASLAPFFPWRG